MKTLLVLTPHKEFAEAIRVMAGSRHFRVLHCPGPLEAETVLARGGVDACLVEADLGEPESVQLIDQLRASFPEGPLLICTASREGAPEEDAYLRGATHVLGKPVRAALLNHLLGRAWPAPRAGKAAVLPPAAPGPASLAAAPDASTETLAAFRRFSVILGHSLQAGTLARQFLLMVREVLRVNRAAVFLRAGSAGPAARVLKMACAVGLPAELLRQFELSLDRGIGACLDRGGRVLRRDSAPAREDEEIRREFDLVGAQVAVPILDRENLLGVALFDRRLTDEAFGPAELALVFHLFEEFGVALKMIWLREQAVAGKGSAGDSPHLVNTLAERLSREVGNALVPLSTHQQLFDQRKGDPEFLHTLQAALENGLRRLSRLASQMHYLAPAAPRRLEAIPLAQLIQDAFGEAQRQHPAPGLALALEPPNLGLVLQGERLGLKHAFHELILNALQASPAEARVSVRAVLQRDARGESWVETEIADAGPGFPPEAADRAARPFFTTRQGGLGLGLTVARQIIESHRGHLEIVSPARPGGGLVRVSLPVDPSAGGLESA